MRSRLLAFIVLVALLPFLTGATIVIRGPMVPAASGGSPALIASVATAGDTNGVTSSAIDTTGANLIVVSVSWYPAAVITTSHFSDSKGNTWTQLNSSNTSGTNTANRLFYCYGGTVGSGHTFTASLNGTYPSVQVLAFSNIASAPFDQQSQAESAAVTTIQPGSITATQANAVLVSAVAFEAGTLSINSSFETPVYVASGSGVDGGISYRIDTSASATNPTWTKTDAASHMSSSIASFKY